jgi:hypothetical protein
LPGNLASVLETDEDSCCLFLEKQFWKEFHLDSEQHPSVPKGESSGQLTNPGTLREQQDNVVSSKCLMDVRVQPKHLNNPKISLECQSEEALQQEKYIQSDPMTIPER